MVAIGYIGDHLNKDYNYSKIIIKITIMTTTLKFISLIIMAIIKIDIIIGATRGGAHVFFPPLAYFAPLPPLPRHH